MTWLNQVGGREVGGGVQSQKTKFPAKATSRFGGMEFPLGRHGVWSLFHTVQITVSSKSTVVEAAMN